MTSLLMSNSVQGTRLTITGAFLHGTGKLSGRIKRSNGVKEASGSSGAPPLCGQTVGLAKPAGKGVVCHL